MIILQNVIDDLTHSTNRLLTALEKFNQDAFNYRVNDSSWSAGEIAEHLIMLERNINKILLSDAHATERSADEKLHFIQTALAGTDRKIQAPSFIIPANDLKEKKNIIEKIIEQREKMKSSAEEKDLKQLCSDFPHPFMGELTRLEWIYFTISHSDRHIYQLNNIIIRED